MFACYMCGKLFEKKFNFDRHISSVHEKKTVKCNKCLKTFSRISVLKLHEKKFHQEIFSSGKRLQSPSPSSLTTPSTDQQIKRMRFSRDEIPSTSKDTGRVLQTNNHKSAYQSKLTDFELVNSDEELLDPAEYLDRSREEITNILKTKLKGNEAIKLNITLHGGYIKPVQLKDEDEVINENFFHTTKSVCIYPSTDLSEVFDNAKSCILQKMDDFQERDSGWALIKLQKIALKTSCYTPLRGSCYLELPKVIGNKKACINIKKDDIFCFKWSVASAVLGENSCNKIDDITKNIINFNNTSLNFTGLEFPHVVKNTKIFELNNNISINIFTYNEKHEVTGPIYHTQMEKSLHINLLYCENDEKSHYVWIKNMSRLINSQNRKESHAVIMCNSCLLEFHSNNSFAIHKDNCKKKVTIMPEEHSVIKFKSIEKMIPVGYTFYLDMESILKPIPGCLPDNRTSSTTNIQEHVPCSFGWYLKGFYTDEMDELKIYTGIKKIIKHYSKRF